MNFNKKNLRLSKSSITTFEMCPAKWKAKYVDGWKPEVMPPAMIKGIELHDLFEKVYENNYSFELLKKDILEIKKTLNNEEYGVHLNNLLKYQSILGSLMPLSVEKKLYCKELNFVGIIDRLQAYDNNKIAVLDYKTGKVNDIKYHVFELSVYVYLCKKVLGITPSFGQILFTQNGELHEIKISNEMINQAKLKIEKTRHSILECLKKDTFEHCGKKWCDYCNEKKKKKKEFVKENS